MLTTIPAPVLWDTLEKDALKEVSKNNNSAYGCFVLTLFSLYPTLPYSSCFFFLVESECAVDVCENNGTCVEHAGSITCNCPEGFIGVFCEEKGNTYKHHLTCY